MKILFLTPQLPYPPHKGTTIRNFHLIRGLASNHEVHLLSFVEGEAEGTALSPLKRYCASVQTVIVSQRSRLGRWRSFLFSPLPDMALRFPSTEFAAKLNVSLRLQSFDAIQVEGIELARYFLALGSEAPPIVFDEHNAEYLLQKRAFQVGLRSRDWAGAFYSLVQWQKLRGYERKVCQRARKVIAVSEEDRAALLRLDPSLDIVVVPNGVDTSLLRPSKGDQNPQRPPTLIFTGTMNFRPNIDAVTWFTNQILPLVRRQIPEVRFLIVGRNPSKAVQLLASPWVTVTGEVEDVRPYLARSSIYVVPMRMGSGVRFKVLEAMAAGLPVVTTKMGAAGIPVNLGKEVLLAEQPSEFCREIVELRRNPALGERLAAEARRLVEREYDWQVILPKLEKVYAGLQA